MDGGFGMPTAILAAWLNDNPSDKNKKGTYMKKLISGGIVLAIGLMTSQITQAQGTMTYISNLGQPSAGGNSVGSDSWYAVEFRTGPNVGGYVLNTVQLTMTDASGSPSGFTVMLYSAFVGAGTSPGSSLGTLSGSLNPVTSGIYTYTPTSSLTLLPGTFYFIVLTAGTAVANGAYGWSYVGTYSYSQSGGWGTDASVLHCSDGSSWSPILSVDAQYAITATPVPEPGVFGLFVLGGLCFLWQCRRL